MSNVSAALKISLDELRMQMLGAQVAFGFQFQSLFQDRFDVSDDSIRIADSGCRLKPVTTEHGTCSDSPARLSLLFGRIRP